MPVSRVVSYCCDCDRDSQTSFKAACFSTPREAMQLLILDSASLLSRLTYTSGALLIEE